MTAKIKLNAASGGGSFSLQAPSSSANNRVITLPDIADGTLVTSESTLDSTKLSPAVGGATFAEARIDVGSGSPTVLRSSGFGSLTDNGTGDFTLAFSATQADANYCALATAGYYQAGASAAFAGIARQGSNGNERANTTSAVNFTTLNSSGDAVDIGGYVYVACLRG